MGAHRARRTERVSILSTLAGKGALTATAALALVGAGAGIASAAPATHDSNPTATKSSEKSADAVKSSKATDSVKDSKSSDSVKNATSSTDSKSSDSAKDSKSSDSSKDSQDSSDSAGPLSLASLSSGTKALPLDDASMLPSLDSAGSLLQGSSLAQPQAQAAPTQTQPASAQPQYAPQYSPQYAPQYGQPQYAPTYSTQQAQQRPAYGQATPSAPPASSYQAAPAAR